MNCTGSSELRYEHEAARGSGSSVQYVVSSLSSQPPAAASTFVKEATQLSQFRDTQSFLHAAAASAQQVDLLLRDLDGHITTIGAVGVDEVLPVSPRRRFQTDPVSGRMREMPCCDETVWVEDRVAELRASESVQFSLDARNLANAKLANSAPYRQQAKNLHPMLRKKTCVDFSSEADIRSAGGGDTAGSTGTSSSRHQPKAPPRVAKSTLQSPTHNGDDDTMDTYQRDLADREGYLQQLEEWKYNRRALEQDLLDWSEAAISRDTQLRLRESRRRASVSHGVEEDENGDDDERNQEKNRNMMSLVDEVDLDNHDLFHFTPDGVKKAMPSVRRNRPAPATTPTTSPCQDMKKKSSNNDDDDAEIGQHGQQLMEYLRIIGDERARMKQVGGMIADIIPLLRKRHVTLDDLQERLKDASLRLVGTVAGDRSVALYTERLEAREQEQLRTRGAMKAEQSAIVLITAQRDRYRALAAAKEEEIAQLRGVVDDLREQAQSQRRPPGGGGGGLQLGGQKNSRLGGNSTSDHNTNNGNWSALSQWSFPHDGVAQFAGSHSQHGASGSTSLRFDENEDSSPKVAGSSSFDRRQYNSVRRGVMTNRAAANGSPPGPEGSEVPALVGGSRSLSRGGSSSSSILLCGGPGRKRASFVNRRDTSAGAGRHQPTAGQGRPSPNIDDNHKAVGVGNDSDRADEIRTPPEQLLLAAHHEEDEGAPVVRRETLPRQRRSSSSIALSMSTTPKTSAKKPLRNVGVDYDDDDDIGDEMIPSRRRLIETPPPENDGPGPARRSTVVGFTSVRVGTTTTAAPAAHIDNISSKKECNTVAAPTNDGAAVARLVSENTLLSHNNEVLRAAFRFTCQYALRLQKRLRQELPSVNESSTTTSPHIPDDDTGEGAVQVRLGDSRNSVTMGGGGRTNNGARLCEGTAATVVLDACSQTDESRIEFEKVLSALARQRQTAIGHHATEKVGLGSGGAGNNGGGDCAHKWPSTGVALHDGGGPRFQLGGVMWPQRSNYGISGPDRRLWSAPSLLDAIVDATAEWVKQQRDQQRAGADEEGDETNPHCAEMGEEGRMSDQPTTVATSPTQVQMLLQQQSAALFEDEFVDGLTVAETRRQGENVRIEQFASSSSPRQLPLPHSHSGRPATACIHRERRRQHATTPTFRHSFEVTKISEDRRIPANPSPPPGPPYHPHQRSLEEEAVRLTRAHRPVCGPRGLGLAGGPHPKGESDTPSTGVGEASSGCRDVIPSALINAQPPCLLAPPSSSRTAAIAARPPPLSSGIRGGAVTVSHKSTRPQPLTAAPPPPM